MDIKTKLNESVKDAMKSGDDVRKRTLRMVLAAVKQAEVDKQKEIDEMAVIGLIQKEVKNRRESIEDAKKAERPDLIAENEEEIKVLEAFLPKAMPDDELKSIVESAIAETGAASMADMGKVMKIVMGKVAGRAPNDKISQAVRELLQS
ncbi:MAG TPA: GatB/YqeY domain-containing protein [Anaerolineales bacterium]|nr:GatB/YqeY domain-containing protein [Anaerolineales bacterium]